VGHTNLAIALQDLGRFDEAIQHFQEAVRLDPDNPVALHNLAAALQASGDLEGAESHYRAALLLRPDLVSARRGLNDLLPEGSME
jgi:Flp pilus assembly protein TadD